jgi:hypothetical protein
MPGNRPVLNVIRILKIKKPRMFTAIYIVKLAMVLDKSTYLAVKL